MHLYAWMFLEENIVQSLVRDESIRIDFRIGISLVMSHQLIYLNFQLKIKLKKDAIDSWQYFKNIKTDNKRISVEFCFVPGGKKKALPGSTSLSIRFNRTFLYVKGRCSALPAKSSSPGFASLSVFCVTPSNQPCLELLGSTDCEWEGRKCCL